MFFQPQLLPEQQGFILYQSLFLGYGSFFDYGLFLGNNHFFDDG